MIIALEVLQLPSNTKAKTKANRTLKRELVLFIRCLFTFFLTGIPFSNLRHIVHHIMGILLKITVGAGRKRAQEPLDVY
jgi:hypothetical protein